MFCYLYRRPAASRGTFSPVGAPSIPGTLTIGDTGRKAVFLCIFTNRAIGGEARGEASHAFAHPRDPLIGDTVLVALVKERNNLPFKDLVQRFRLGGILGGVITAAAKGRS